MKAIWNAKAQGKFDADFDCYLAESLLSEGRFFGSQEDTLKRYKATTLEELAHKQFERLAEFPKLAKLFKEIEMPLSKVLWQMEQHGILLDSKQLQHVGQDIDEQITQTQAEIDKVTGGDININSSVQLGSFLAEKEGIPLGRTKTGKYATNEAELSQFADQFPIIAHILKYRELTKLRSTYVESLIQKVDDQSKIHTTYNQVLVSTGRLASSNPNLQNIPVTSEIGLEIKSCFVAAPGHSLVSFDYSQQELRILAHLAGEKELIKAFERNQDVHKLTASRLFSVEYDNVTKPQRQVGKTINFGIIYGMSGFGLSAALHISQEEAEAFIKQFYVSYPSIKSYYDDYLKNAKIHGVVETMLGRRRYVFEDPRRKFLDNSMRRVLMNYPIQGTAADLMRKSMVDIDQEILSKYSEISLLLTIHDDLVFQIPDDDKEKLETIIKHIQTVLCSVFPLAVPLVVDVKIGKKWGALTQMQFAA